MKMTRRNFASTKVFVYVSHHISSRTSPLILCASPQNMIPFAVVGSERNVIIDGKTVRGRKNRWGVINIEDERHCEFVYLRNFLTRSDRYS